MRFTFCFNAPVMTRGSPWSLSVMNICSPVPKHCAPFSDTGRVHNMFAIDCNKSSVNFTGSNVFPSAKSESRLAPHSGRDLISARSLSQPVTLTTWKSSLHKLHQVTIYTLLNTPNDWSGTMKQLRGLYAQTFFTFWTNLIYPLLCDDILIKPCGFLSFLPRHSLNLMRLPSYVSSLSFPSCLHAYHFSGILTFFYLFLTERLSSPMFYLLRFPPSPF